MDIRNLVKEQLESLLENYTSSPDTVASEYAYDKLFNERDYILDKFSELVMEYVQDEIDTVIENELDDMIADFVYEVM